MATVDQRVGQLEGIILKHDERMARMARLEERMADMLADQDARQTAHEAFLERMDARQAVHEAFVLEMNARQAEARRDIQQMHRLWVRIARRYGWTDLFSDEEDD